MTNKTDHIETPSADRSIRQAIVAAEAEKERWEHQRIEAEERIEALERVLTLQRQALRAYTKGVVPSTEAKFDYLKRADLEGVSIKRLLIMLAQEDSNSVVRGLDAVRVLMRTGVVTDRRSADAQVYTVLNREKDSFYKIRPGEYAFIGESAPAPEPTPDPDALPF